MPNEVDWIQRRAKFHGVHASFENGVQVQTQDFDYDAVDNKPDSDSNNRTLPSEILKKFLAYCWGSSGKNRRHVMRIPFQRFAILSAMVDPELVGNQDFTQLARQLKLTKAAVSRQAVRMCDELGVHFRMMRRQGARENMSKARLGQTQGGKVVGRR